jgi:hypothetical protein
MIWLVSGYRKSRRANLVCEYELSGVDSLLIQQLFGGEDGEPVMLEEVSTADQRQFLESHLGIALDTAKLRYFIEAYSEPGKSETVRSRSGEVWYLPPMTLPAFPEAKRVRPQ